MSRRIRSSVVFVAVTVFTFVLLARSTAPLQGQGQPAPPTAAQIAPFVGDWLVTLPFMANEATLAVAVKADGGKVSATVSADGQPTVADCGGVGIEVGYGRRPGSAAHASAVAGAKR